MEQKNFDDIRPFFDGEARRALKEIMAEPEFPAILSDLFPARDVEEIYAELKSYRTLDEFQRKFVVEVVKIIIQRSVKELTSSGIENLDHDKVYLFISNHRDIVLDPTLMGFILLNNGFSLPQLAIGNNLCVSPFITKIFKLNKSFIVLRNVQARQLYEAWQKLSIYIYHIITNRKENIWIAQREGRAKDGNDRTQPGIIKMFLLNYTKNYINVIRRLNIMPVSITYEYDPCDYLKAFELYHVANGLPFDKGDEFNAQSMIYGIKGRKGRVHYAFGRPVSEMIHHHKEPRDLNEWIKWLAGEIDLEIHRNYHLWPSNYIAFDLLHRNRANADKYTCEEEAAFIERIQNNLAETPEEIKDEIYNLMLTNYANSVANHLKALERKE